MQKKTYRETIEYYCRVAVGGLSKYDEFEVQVECDELGISTPYFYAHFERAEEEIMGHIAGEVFMFYYLEKVCCNYKDIMREIYELLNLVGKEKEIDECKGKICEILGSADCEGSGRDVLECINKYAEIVSDWYLFGAFKEELRKAILEDERLLKYDWVKESVLNIL